MTAADPAAPLAGRHIVVTRPEHQAGDLAALIRAAGGEPLLFPLLEILPANDPQPLAAAVAAIDTYDYAFFISPNAVNYSVPALLERGWPGTLRAAAVGQGTARALSAFGVTDVIVPSERFDSEALLAQPELSVERVTGRRVAIFRGDGGRELLADTLRERGAVVDCVTCYERRAPAGGAAWLAERWAAGRLDAITISSSEGLRHLVDMLDPAGLEHLKRTPVFAPHPRIVDNARALGLDAIATGPADAGLLAGLCAYNWPPQP